MLSEMGWDTIQSYVESLVPDRPDEMKLMEQQALDTGFPILGPACGSLCYQIARTIQARRVFELGSGFGYSTAWFARAVVENGGGKVDHVVWDETLSKKARDHLHRLGYSSVVDFHVSEAVEALRRAEGPFDLIFNDIDKEGYPEALPVIAAKLRKGGVLLVDNLLWHGRVFDPRDTSPSTVGVRQLTSQIRSDPRWISTILPLRDGLLMATLVG